MIIFKNISVFGLVVFTALAFQHVLNQTESKAQTPMCYGQHVPVCGLSMTPVCICTSRTGQDCSYVCMPKK